LNLGQKFLKNFVLLKRKTCSLYHKNLLLPFIQVLEIFHPASDIMEAGRGQSQTTQIKVADSKNIVTQ
jgi:hypothetical protein